MSVNKKNIVLADCPSRELQEFIKGLNSKGSYHFECINKEISSSRKGKIAELKRYIAYFVGSWQAFINRKSFKIIIGWQQFYVLIFCFYCNLLHVKKENITIALNFTYKEKHGLIGKIYAKFIRLCVTPRYLDYIHVPSNNYAEMISKDLSFPLNRIIVAPFGIDDIYGLWKNSDVPKGLKKEAYAMTIGRSNRDFDFLVEIWKKINYPLIIISDTYIPSKPLPKNVTLIDNVSGDAQYPYMVNSKFIIIPIDDGRICSGDTVLLTAFSFERTTVVTKPSTLGEMYIRDGINGYLVEKETDIIIPFINDIINGTKPNVGIMARNSFLEKFSRFSMGRRVNRFLEDKQTK